MKSVRIGIDPRRLRRIGIKLLQAAVLALILALAMPAGAAGGRSIKERVAPIYPEIAKRLKISGTVEVEATVEPDGKVSSVKTITGNRMLSTAAEDAVRRWRYEPAPGKDTVLIQINFDAGQ